MKIKSLFTRNSFIIFIWISFIVVFLMGCSEKNNPPPVIESISPTEGYIGDPVTLSGKNLGNPIRILFNQVESDIALGTDMMITTVVPNNAAIGNNSISIENEGGISNTVSFNVIEDTRVKDEDPPSISKLYPSTNFWNHAVLIYGDNLSSAKITFNDIPAIVTTNNKTVVTTTVPAQVPPGIVKLKITTPRGGSNTLDFTVSGPPPAGAAVVNFSIVAVPPPGYIPAISNFWSCGLFSVETIIENGINGIYKGTFGSLNIIDSEGNSNIEGTYEFGYNKEIGYNTLNFVEIKNIVTGEIWVGQFSSEFDFPCVLQMVLVSTETGKVFVCDFDRSGFGNDCES